MRSARPKRPESLDVLKLLRRERISNCLVLPKVYTRLLIGGTFVIWAVALVRFLKGGSV